MNDSIIVYKSRNYSDSNGIYDYDLQIRSGMTLSDFVNAVLEDTNEWGIIEARINGHPIANIRYSDGKVVDVFTPDESPIRSLNTIPYRCACASTIGAYLGPRHVKDTCKAFGKGSRMDYIVLLEEEKR